MRTLILGAALVAAMAADARAQLRHAVIDTMPDKRSGPRYGVIWLSPALADSISVRNGNQKVNSTTSIFGWDFETQLMRNPKGVAPITSLVLGVAGLDQGLALPSATWIVGVRTQDDFEVGIGPNASLAGVALAVTAGRTFHSGSLHIPVDVAWVSSKFGQRVSLTTGFNVMK